MKLPAHDGGAKAFVCSVACRAEAIMGWIIVIAIIMVVYRSRVVGDGVANEAPMWAWRIINYQCRPRLL